MYRYLCFLLALFVLVYPAAADGRDLRLDVDIKARLEGLSFQVKPAFITTQGEDVRIELMPENGKGNSMVLKMTAKELEGNRVDVNAELLVNMSGKTIERKFRFQTLLNYPGFFAIEDKKRQEFLEVELTPTLATPKR